MVCRQLACSDILILGIPGVIMAVAYINATLDIAGKQKYRIYCKSPVYVNSVHKQIKPVPCTHCKY